MGYTELLPRLRLSLPGQNGAADSLLLELLQQAEGLILAYTGRDALPMALESAQIMLAVVLYNRLGTEGESIRREGGALMHFEALPRLIEAQLKPYRLAKAVP